jgi:superoxide dismutase, Fe-Mn family
MIFRHRQVMTNGDHSPLSRREALKILGVTAAVAGFASRPLLAADAAQAQLYWALPPMGFAFGALEPHIDARTMEIHYTKHHQAYINNAKKLLEPHPDLLARGPEALVRDLAAVPESIRAGVRNNVGGHVNHAFFWKLLSPAAATGINSQGRLAGALAAAFGAGSDSFKQPFAEAALKRFGSGWAWLSAKPDGQLMIHSTANQDSPLSDGLTPIFGLDVWEHAYYLHYQNRRSEYVAAFWNVLNWQQAETNYAAAVRG